MFYKFAIIEIGCYIIFRDADDRKCHFKLREQSSPLFSFLLGE